MGSAVSITLGLAVVLVIFYFTGLDEPRIRDEFSPVLGSLGWFSVLTVASATSFIGTLRERSWRWLAQLLMWGCMVLIGWRFWPA